MAKRNHDKIKFAKETFIFSKPGALKGRLIRHTLDTMSMSVKQAIIWRKWTVKLKRISLKLP